MELKVGMKSNNFQTSKQISRRSSAVQPVLRLQRTHHFIQLLPQHKNLNFISIIFSRTQSKSNHNIRLVLSEITQDNGMMYNRAYSITS